MGNQKSCQLVVFSRRQLKVPLHFYFAFLSLFHLSSSYQSRLSPHFLVD
ncbi:hypothetical protein [Listeria monocytogenes]